MKAAKLIYIAISQPKLKMDVTPFNILILLIMRSIYQAILKFIGWILLVPVYFYKYAISPLTPASCRHYPTCSEYALQAIKIHGPFKGVWLASKRIARCHPWGTSGYDPVPPKKEKGDKERTS
jgi:hypothetical protein